MKKIFAIIFSLQLIISPVAMAQDQNAGLQDAYLETGTGGQGGSSAHHFSIGDGTRVPVWTRLLSGYW
jgi:hypothetical protein